MSFLLSFKAAKCTLGNSSVKAVLRCLCDYANDDGSSCRPATSTISAETELNKKTVFKAVASLAEAGWIEVSSLNGRQNFYQINVAKIEAAFLETKADKQQTNTKIGTGVNFGTGTKNGSGTDTKNGTKTSTKFGTSTKNGPIPVPKTVHNSVNTQSIINNSKEEPRTALQTPLRMQRKIHRNLISRSQKRNSLRNKDQPLSAPIVRIKKSLSSITSACQNCRASEFGQKQERKH